MSHRARNALLALSCAIACAVMLPSAASALVVGIGDQTTRMFADPRFFELHIHEARLTVSWDVATNRKRRSELRADQIWLKDAAADGITPLVSFSGNGNYIPNVPQYTRAISAFVHKFPKVKRYTAWNEPDWIYRSLSRHPGLAAAFFNALVRHCHRCTVIAGDLYLPAKQLGPWIRAYKKGLRFRPVGWALHNYFDVRGHTTAQLQTMLKLTSGPIWLDEISGVEFRGHWQFPQHQSAKAAGRDEQFLFSLAKRFKRISRIYHYQWQSVPGTWDSGLISPTGQIRPAYHVVQRAAAH